jgi:trans-aconitate 2-methyltransferase
MAEVDAKPWDPDLYEGRHSFVWKAAADLLKRLDPRGSERILDLGCGTGQLTAAIASTGAEVLGLDHSPAMIEQARTNYPHIRFELGDGADFRVDAPMDAVFSNAALHWMTRPAAVAACVHAALRPGGRFVAELGGKGNVQGIHGALAEAIRAAGLTPLEESALLYFPSVAEYARVLEDAGFRVTYATHFDRPIRLDGGAHGLRTWIAMFADRFLAVVPEDRRDAVLVQVEDRLHATLYHDDAWHADYVRLRVVAVR